MSHQSSPVHRAVETALANDTALTLRDIRVLREKHERILLFFKGNIWAAVAVLNLVVWVDLPLSTATAFAIGGLAVVYAFSLPIVMIRRHQRYLPFFEKVSPGPKKRRVDEAGLRYLERVKEQGRSFIVAEVEVLEGPGETPAAD